MINDLIRNLRTALDLLNEASRQAKKLNLEDYELLEAQITSLYEIVWYLERPE